MTACPSENALAGLVDGASVERDAIEAHVDRCASCARTLSELGGLLVGRPAPAGYRVLGPTRFGWRAETRDRTPVELRLAPRALEPTARAMRALDVGRYTAEAIYVALPLRRDEPTARRWCEARPTGERLALWKQVGAALVELHARELAHGTITPDHVAVDDRGAPQLIGFAAPDVHPAYVAPERRAGDPPTAAADQLAFAVSLWECLAGARPFAGSTRGALAVSMALPLELPRGAIHAALAPALQRDPARRYPSMSALLRALSRG